MGMIPEPENTEYICISCGAVHRSLDALKWCADSHTAKPVSNNVETKIAHRLKRPGVGVLDF